MKSMLFSGNLLALWKAKLCGKREPMRKKAETIPLPFS